MSTLPRVGDEFAGYRLLAVLGRGGMSVVFQAENPRLGSLAALKVLAPELAENDVFRARFLQESKTAASLTHPNVIPIYDMGTHEDLLYLAMRYVSGTDLRALIRAHHRLTPTDSLYVVGQAGRALDLAHQHGLVHRDVKPGNILVESGADADDPDHVYLADFGIAKHALSSSGLTDTGQFMGTVDYVAPEQIQARRVDAAADLYSLGCVLFECLTGQVPFIRDIDAAVLWAHVEDDPPRASALRPGLPIAIDEVLTRALAKDPADRYPTSRAMMADARAAFDNPDLNHVRLLSRTPGQFGHPADPEATRRPDRAAPAPPPPAVAHVEEPAQEPPAGSAAPPVASALPAAAASAAPPDSPAGHAAAAPPAAAAGTGERSAGAAAAPHPAASGPPPGPPPGRPLDDTPDDPSSGLAAGASDTNGRGRTRTPLLAAAAVLVVLAGAAGTGAWMFSHDGESTSAARTSGGASGPSAQTTNPLLLAISKSPKSMLPASSCEEVDAMHVVCTDPTDTITRVDLRRYRSLDALYDSYVAAASSLTGEPFRANMDDCNRREVHGEVSWNHDFQHPTQFSLAQSRSGQLSEMEAEGRVFCAYTGGSMHFVWTDNDGLVLGTVEGFDHERTWKWWHDVHHRLPVGYFATHDASQPPPTGMSDMTPSSDSPDAERSPSAEQSGMDMGNDNP